MADIPFVTVADSIPAAFALLPRLDNAAADTALVEILPELRGRAQATAFDLLVRRGDAARLAPVLGRFDALDESLQTLIVSRARGLFAAVRTAIGSSKVEQRTGAIEVIVRSDTSELAYLLADALRVQCPRTRALAAEGLHRMADQWLLGSGADVLSADAGRTSHAGFLAQALQAGIMTWEIHHQPKVLEAAVWMAGHLMPAIRLKLDDPKTKIGHMLNEILTVASSPRLAGFAVRALAVPVLRAAAARAIGDARDITFIRAVLSHGWLLADDEIRRGCRWIRASRWLHQGMEEFLGFDRREAAAALQLLDAAGGSHEARIERCRELLDAGDHDLRTAVLWRLFADPSEAASDLLTTIAGRSSDELARLAMREVKRRRPDSAPPTRAVDLDDDTVPGSAARKAFDELWQRFDRSSPPDRASLVERIGGDLFKLLRARLSGSAPADRARAVRVARAVGVVKELQEHIFGLAHDPDSVVRSAAISALADLPGPTSVRILRAAVDDADPRVQADAIEALDRLDTEERIPVTQPKLESPHNRVRANAVKSLLRVELEQAGEVLLDMLEDHSRAQRLSALWVVRRLELGAVLHRIAEMSDSDPDERVKARAARVMHELLQRTTPEQGVAGGLAVAAANGRMPGGGS